MSPDFYDVRLTYGLPPKWYYKGQEVRYVCSLHDNKVRITIIETGKTIDVPIGEVTAG